MKMRQTPKTQPANQHARPKSTAKHLKAGTFAEHIAELRRRFAYIALVFVVGSCLAYTYHDTLAQAIMAPLNGQKLVYLTPGGGFSFIFQISLYSGLILAAPFIVYHLYAFIKPALPMQARRSASKVVSAAVGLLSLGIAYGYFVAVPAALHFLAGFAGDAITPNLTADSYLSFFLSYIGGLALLSLMPLLLVFWHWINPLTPGGLLKSERWIVLLAFIAAAIITPTPDAANQAMIAGPVIFLYQFGVIAVLVSLRRQKRIQRQAARYAAKQIDDDEKLDELVASWALDTSNLTLQKPASSSRSTAAISTPAVTTAAIHPDKAHSESRLQRPISMTTPQASQLAGIQPIKSRGTMDIMPRSGRREVRRPANGQHAGQFQDSHTLQQIDNRARSSAGARHQFSLDGIFRSSSAQAEAPA